MHSGIFVEKHIPGYVFCTAQALGCVSISTYKLRTKYR